MSGTEDLERLVAFLAEWARPYALALDRAYLDRWARTLGLEAKLSLYLDAEPP